MDQNDPVKQPLIPQEEDMVHGDSALAIIGNRRIQVTEEDVCIPTSRSFFAFVIIYVFGLIFDHRTGKFE